MRSVENDPRLVAYCGLYCGACGAYLKERCPGCHENVKAKWCKVRSCCLENHYATCADCKQFQTPRECRKYNNLISRLFGLIFRSDRAACIGQIKQMGLECHARTMAEQKTHSIKRT